MHVVTGGAGFIGSNVVAKLNEMGIEEILVVDELGNDEKWQNLVHRTYKDYVHKDEFLRLLQIGGFGENIDVIIHLGACSSTTETDADFLYKNNFRYSRTVCEWALANQARFIYASSAATYGDGTQGYSDTADLNALRPLNMYGYSKHLFDLWSKRMNVADHVVGLKFFNVFGPNEQHKGDMRSVVCKAYEQIRDTGTVKLFKSYRDEYPDGGQDRDFVYVKDCVDVIAWFLENKDANGLFNLGTGTARTWNDLANSVFAAMDTDPNITYIDMPEQLQGKYQYHTQAEMQKLRDAGCDVSFRSLEDAAADYIQNHLSQPDPYL